MQKIGTYHLGSMYNLEDFLLMDTVDVFPVNELMPNNKTIPRYLVLSQLNILNFEIIGSYVHVSFFHSDWQK